MTPTGTITAATPRQAILEALAARTAATATELAIDAGLDVRLVKQLLLALAVGGRVKRAGMAKTGDGLELIWSMGGKR